MVFAAARAGSWSASPGWPTRQGDVLQLAPTRRRRSRTIWHALLAERQDVPDRRAADPGARRCWSRSPRQPARRGWSPLRVARRRLHRRLPRHPDDPAGLPVRASGCRRWGCQGVPTSLFFWAPVALVLSYGAYVAEVFRAGIESIHPSQVASAEALGLSPRPDDALRRRPAGGAPRRTAAAQRLRLAAEGHRAGRRRSAVFDALFAAQRLRQLQLQLHAATSWSPCFFIVLTVPLARLTDWLGAPRDASGSWQGGRDDARCSRSTDLRKSYGDRVVLDDVDLTVAAARRGLPDRLVGLGQVDAAALPQPARGHRRRRDRLRRPRDLRPARRPARGAQPDRDGLPGLQPLPAPDRARQLHPRAAPGARRTDGPRRRQRARDAARRGSASPTRRTSTPTGSPAASSSGSRWSARSCTQPDAAAARRDHRRPRPRAGRRGARRSSATWPSRAPR